MSPTTATTERGKRIQREMENATKHLDARGRIFLYSLEPDCPHPCQEFPSVYFASRTLVDAPGRWRYAEAAEIAGWDEDLRRRTEESINQQRANGARAITADPRTLAALLAQQQQPGKKS